jgi:NhaC family Na+:H+ antiporter
MAAALGVPTLGYAIYCFFNLLNPIVTIVFSFLAFRVLRTPGSLPAKSNLTS